MHIPVYICVHVRIVMSQTVFLNSSISLLLASYNQKKSWFKILVTPGLNKFDMDLFLQLIWGRQMELIKNLILNCASAYKLLREAVWNGKEDPGSMETTENNACGCPANGWW